MLLKWNDYTKNKIKKNWNLMSKKNHVNLLMALQELLDDLTSCPSDSCFVTYLLEDATQTLTKQTIR